MAAKRGKGGKSRIGKKTRPSKKVATKGRKRKPGQRNTSRRRTSLRSGRGGLPLARWLLAGLVLVALLLGGYSLYLGKSVRVAFEGKRWSVPARIYARPLELYVGAPLQSAQLAYELGILGYRKVGKIWQGAQWSGTGGDFSIKTRDFRFWDGPAPGVHLRVRVRDGRVSSLRSASGAEVHLARLEPAEIGSIYPAHREDRILLRREQIPEHLVKALLAVEDRRFFEHHGVDPRGIARAVWANLRAGGVVQGGSTLTQQLVKNFILSPERSLARKFNEALMALIVEARYDKDDILEAYANEIYLGQDRERAIHGFGLGALFYFNRPLDELQLHETALLVGLVKGASFYNPRRHPERAKARRDLVIDAMQRMGFIDSKTAEQAKSRPLGVSRRGRLEGHRYPAFIQLVRRQLQRDYREQDLTSEGLRVFTTLDPWDQYQAAQGLSTELATIEKARGIDSETLQGAMVIADSDGGEVRALVGGRTSGVSGFNRALDAVRPVGSVIKPAVYLSALAEPQRYTLATLLRDQAVDLKLPNGDRWQPRNYDRKIHGKVPLHQALSSSLNLATVNLGMELGVNRVLRTLRQLGLERDLDPFPSLLLGAAQLSPFEVTQWYQTIAAGGFRSPLRAIREVLDSRDRPLQRYSLEVEQSVDPLASFLLTRNLQEVVTDGTGRGLSRFLAPSLAVAGKTGTTNDLRDSWFAGFTGGRVATVWVGRDDNRPTGLTGSSGALPVYGRVMRNLQVQPLVPVQPPGIEYHWVESVTGRRSAEGCTGARLLPFAHGSAPRQASDCATSLSERGRSLLERLFD